MDDIKVTILTNKDGFKLWHRWDKPNDPHPTIELPPGITFLQAAPELGEIIRKMREDFQSHTASLLLATSGSIGSPENAK